MKNLFSIASVVLVALLMTSCVGMRVGGNFGSERFKYNNSDSFRPSEVKSDITKASNTETSSETGFYVGISFIDITILFLSFSEQLLKLLFYVFFPI